MIRFWDQAVINVEFNTLDRNELLEYFGSGHDEDIICVYDAFVTMEFMGILTYQSLKMFPSVCEAVRSEYLILNRNIWENAREYCRRHPYSGMKYPIPVLDQNQQLYCFAYEDLDSNREIRMLRELTELPDAVQFTDIYPEYKCVKIFGFNELAFYFAKYLERLSISVEVSDAMWQNFFDGQKCTVSDSEVLTIYAEGIHRRRCNWKENLLRSVSVEFECIDKIYEANINSGKFSNVEETNIGDLLIRLKQETEIIIFGTGREEQNSYNYLLGKGIQVCCFIGNDHECAHKLFGKRIMTGREARRTYKDAVFVDCVFNNSV